jgi:hypothetical protein
VSHFRCLINTLPPLGEYLFLPGVRAEGERCLRAWENAIQDSSCRGFGLPAAASKATVESPATIAIAAACRANFGRDRLRLWMNSSLGALWLLTDFAGSLQDRAIVKPRSVHAQKWDGKRVRDQVDRELALLTSDHQGYRKYERQCSHKTHAENCAESFRHLQRRRASKELRA